jgi:very-short-patch-repair endonuclease
MTDKEIPFEKSFASHEKAKYWSNKNNLKPNEISKGSDKKIYFNCDKCNHEFLIQLNIVSRGGWCNYCSNTKLCQNNDCELCFNKSFASNEKSKYWSNKNEVTPRQIFKSTAKKYLFNCDKCKHEFTNDPAHISIGRWCPYCCIPQKQLCGNINCKDCFDKSFASHEKSKYWSNKNELKPEFVLKMGDKKIWFNCNVCNHEFQSQIKGITKGNWCPYCSNHQLCGVENCIGCFDKSFASHDKSKYWSNKNELKPRQIFSGSGNKFLFNCDKCNHEFDKTICDITGNKNGWCPYCANKKMCIDDNCNDCFNKSFASHEKVIYWSSKNKENPRHLFQGDSNKYLFNCNKCNHEFDAILYNIKTGYWCPYCSNNKLCLNDDCIDCFNKSFASNKILDRWKWSNKNKEKPRELFKYSNNKYWFICNLCNNEFDRCLSSLDNQYNNVCSWCRYKTEFDLFESLKMNYPTIIMQFKQDWCKKINHLPFDLCIQEYNVIIELDGPQHFTNISCWKSLEIVQEYDKYKQKCANENGYSIIRLLQTDVYNNKYDWKTELINNIEKIKIDNIIQNIYMCKNNEYENFMN